jgi:serine phosphatase RsbU (regulator of sigma subunit)
MKIYKICIFLVLIYSAVDLYAQNKYKTLNNSDIVEYRSKDGLPSTVFSNAVKTKDGYIWLSGAEGTFRFDGYEFATVGKEYGIPEMQSIYYDSTKNILYFASPDKFATFDGSKFKIYNASSGYKLNENKGQLISFIKGDSKGRIWIGSYTPFTDKRFNGSLVVYENNEFTLFDSETFPLDNARNFIETPFGDIIFTSLGKNTQNGDGAYIALYKNNKFTRIDNSFGFNFINSSIRDDYSSYIDLKGNLWIPFVGNLDYASVKGAKGTGVLMYDGENFHTYPGLDRYLNNNIGINDVFCDNENNKIYVTLNFISLAAKRISKSFNPILELKNNKWEPSKIIDQIIDAKGVDKSSLNFQYNFSRFLKTNKPPYLSLIFGTLGLSFSSVDPTQFFMNSENGWKKYDAFKGIPILDLDNGTMILTAKGVGFLTPNTSILLKEKDGILKPDVQIPDLYPDRNGLVWVNYSYSQIPTYIGLNDVGLNVWDGNKLKALTVKDGLKSNTTFTPCQDINLNIWIPTDRGLTQVREIQNSGGEWVFKLKSVPTNIREDYNTSEVFETKDGGIYAFQNYVRPDYGSVKSAEFFLGKVNGDRVVEIESPFRKELQAMPYQLYSLREDLQGRIWLQGEFADKLEELSSVKSELKIYDGKKWDDPPAEWDVPQQQLHLVGELRDEAYYLTTDHFYKFDGRKFIDLSDSSNENGDFRILKGASVAGTRTRIQSGEYLYIRLRNRGLAIFNGTKLNFYTPRNSIIPTDIHNPTFDYKNNLFFGSQSGAVRLRGEKVDIFYDDERITAGGSATAVMDMNGNLLKFYSGVGILIEKNVIQKAPLKITSMIVNDEAFHYKFANDFKASENSILFNYAVLSFSNPGQSKYSHILEGYDTEWSRESNLSFTEYQNLPPGKYTFRVRATIGGGELSEEDVYSFIISPPLWKTWWAYSIYICLFLIFLYTLREFELRRQRKNSAIKESELRAEAAEAQSRAIEAENRRKTQELEEARKLQLSMLPKKIPQLPNLDIAVYINTATEVGGDYYDFHVHIDGTLTVVLGDATGHGMQSGMMVSIIKSLFMSDRSNKELKPFFENTNRSIKDMDLGRLMMALTCVQFHSSKIKIANAGMPSLMIYRKSLKEIEEVAINDLPLGAMKEFEYTTVEKDIYAGDTLLMISDGFPELTNDEDEMLGYSNVRSYFSEVAEKSPESIVGYLKEKGINWSNGKENKDDVTFLVIKVK